MYYKIAAPVLIAGVLVAAVAHAEPPANSSPKGALVSVPLSGIVKMTSSFKRNGVPGESCMEIMEWGNVPIKEDFVRQTWHGKPGLPLDGNFFRNARDIKVGDYVTFKVTEGQRTKRCKLIVFDKDEKTVRVGMISGYTRGPWTIDVSKPFDISTAMHVNGSWSSPSAGFRTQDGFQKTGEGKETLKIGDTSYDCTWIKGTVNTTTVIGGPFTSEVKIWIADNAPARTQPKALVPPKNAVSLCRPPASSR